MLLDFTGTYGQSRSVSYANALNSLKGCLVLNVYRFTLNMQIRGIEVRTDITEKRVTRCHGYFCEKEKLRSGIARDRCVVSGEKKSYLSIEKTLFNLHFENKTRNLRSAPLITEGKNRIYSVVN